MGAQYKYLIDLQAGTTQFERNMQRAETRAREVATSTQTASVKVSASLSQMGKNAESVLSSIGGAIGGTSGKITDLIGSLMGVAGPISLAVALIGGIGMAWQKSKENVDDYLAAVNKATYGAALFTQDSKGAMRDTKGRAEGGINEGIRLQDDATRRLGAFGANYTKEQREQLELQKAIGIQMVTDNNILAKSMGYEQGILTNRIANFEWIQKYNKLQLENEKLEEKKITTATEINDLESKLLEIKTKIASPGSESEEEKQKLKNQYLEIAGQIQKKKLGLLDEEKTITGGLLSMTAKGHELELLDLHLANQKAEITRAYNVDIFNTVKLQNQVNTEGKKEIAGKEKILSIEEATLKALENQELVKQRNAAGPQKQGARSPGGFGKTYSAGLKKMSGAKITEDPLEASKEWVKTLALFANVEDPFALLADSSERLSGTLMEGANSFKEYAGVVVGGIKKVIGALLAESVATSIAAALKSAKFAGPAGVFLIPVLAALGAGLARTAFNSLIPKFAEGGLISGPTIGVMGEYPGAKTDPELIAPLSKIQNLIQPAMTSGEVVFRIGERELVGLLVKADRINKNIRGRR
jgi:hypothetical protein